MNCPTHLYRHFDAAGKLLYVGQTENIFGRLATHKVKDFDDVLFFPCDVDQLDAIEEEHLANLRPELNSEGVRKPFRPSVATSMPVACGWCLSRALRNGRP